MYILGLTGALGHDAAACIMHDGKLIAMIEEERLTRISHSLGALPIKAIEFCLNKANVCLDEIDYIAISWDKSLIEEKKLIPQEKYFNTRYDNLNNLFPRSIFNYRKLPKVEIIDHHLAHAASTYYLSPFEEASVLVIDGAGEDCSTSLYCGENGELTKLFSIHHNESLGMFYNAVTEHLGFDWTDAGKTMGLASFGEPTYEFNKIQLDSQYGYKINMDHSLIFDKVMPLWRKEFFKMGIPMNEGKRVFQDKNFKYSTELEFNQTLKNFAASAQKTLEDCYLNLVKVLVKQTGIRKLCLAGGVALNCVANGKIASSGLVDDIFIQPASGDAGAAIGAAAQLSSRLGIKVAPLESAYLGPSFTNDEIIKLLNHLGISYSTYDDVTEPVSIHLMEGKVVGWFQGQAEFGPRALGNRSILANPSIEGIQDIVNNKIKLRESFRPFGPSILESHAQDWFEDISPSPYMLKAFTVKKSKSDKIPGVVHVDGTSRPQTVTKEINGKYHALLQSFYKKSGIPLVLNTSFNLKGEPMVASPYDAIRTFYTSSLDVLVLNDLIIRK
jgi:carbamoyltransferase